MYRTLLRGSKTGGEQMLLKVDLWGMRFALSASKTYGILYNTMFAIIFYWLLCVVPDGISSSQGRRVPAGACFAALANYDCTQDSDSSNAVLCST
jgi:hypothetical protein